MFSIGRFLYKLDFSHTSEAKSQKAESTLAYTETEQNQIPLILSISGIIFGLYLYYPILLILNISQSQFCLVSV